MTFEEYNKFKEDFFKKEQEKVNHNIKLFKENEQDIKKYHIEYMSKQFHYGDSFYEFSAEDAIDMIKDTVKYLKFEKHDKKPGFETHIEAEGSSWEPGDFDIEEVTLIAYWYNLRDEEETELEMKQQFRKTIGEELNKETTWMSRLVDCKVLEMFEAQEITWKGMKKLTYGNCQL